MDVFLYKSRSKKKEYKAIFKRNGAKIKTIYFGSKGASTFPIHKDVGKKENYIARHAPLNEDWTYRGLMTPGFWARWLLWNKDTIDKSIRDIELRFNVNIFKKF